MSNTPAFPIALADGYFSTEGLTKREYAAIHIAAGFRGLETWTFAEIARAAANQADALLAELERTDKPTPICPNCESPAPGCNGEFKTEAGCEWHFEGAKK